MTNTRPEDSWRLVYDETGEDIAMWTMIEGSEGDDNIYVIEALVDHWEVGPMVLVSHQRAGAHLVRPSVLRCHIEIE